VAISHHKPARAGVLLVQQVLLLFFFLTCSLTFFVYLSEQACYWYSKAAHQGHGKAQFNLALRFTEGLGTLIEP
jgi:TPR repeat protein